jgi:D-amino peptidase
MKIYISADIEGTTGIVNWDETEKSKQDHASFALQMSREVKAACLGAINAGANEIWIKDAHDSGRNINIEDFPENVKLIRAWSGHPFSMMQEIDETFDAAIMIGYHSNAGSNHNPLAHTMDTSNFFIKINDEYASEFLINTYTALMVNVPVIFVSGDEGLCNQVSKFNNSIETFAVNKGVGNSVISIHPKLAADNIQSGVYTALKKDINRCINPLPEKFKVEISFKNHYKAYKASFYPGMRQISPNNIIFETDNYFEVLRMIAFVV